MGDDGHTLTDGDRVVNIYSVLRLRHVGTMLIVHLPAKRILINADLYSPPAPGTNPPAVTPNMRSLAHNIEQLGLDVARHGRRPRPSRVGSHVDFLRQLNGK